ncbi:MAG: tRNA pseudouridine(13) synthase TruD [Planctomycetota bacterium]
MESDGPNRAWTLESDETAGFAARQRHEDFHVEELPLGPPAGEGEHLSLWIEKRGLSTPEAQARLASALRVERRRFGRAGLKDADGVTLQELSIHDPQRQLDPSELEGLQVGAVRVLRASRRERGLQPGDLLGNRFRLKLRDVDPDGLRRLERGLSRLTHQGVPARFGPQRFGLRGDGARIGLALLRDDFDEVVALACGRPGPADHGPVREARELFDGGDPRAAAERFPPSYGASARLARAVASNRGRSKNALRALPRTDVGWWVQAAQSEVFNRIVDERAPHLGRLLAGDVLRPTEPGRDRRIEGPEPWQAAADRFEVSPTGLLPGTRVRAAEAEAGAAEARAMASLGVDPAHFERSARFGVPGTRRPLRLRLTEPAVWTDADDLGPHVGLRFDLPPGGYATTVLEELSRGRVSYGG